MAVAVASRRPGEGYDRLFADEVAGREQGDGGLLAAFGDDGEFGAAGLEVEDGVGGVPLGEEDLLGLEAYEMAAQPRGGEEGDGVEL